MNDRRCNKCGSIYNTKNIVTYAHFVVGGIWILEI